MEVDVRPSVLPSEWKESPSRKVKIAVADLDGILRGKFLHIDKFHSVAESSMGFCNVVFGWDCGDRLYEQSDYTGWHTGYPDATVRLDLATCRKIPWHDNTPLVLGEFIDAKGEALPVCPRQVLRRVIQKAKNMGFSSKIGSEFEWFNFLETAASLEKKGYQQPIPLTPGMFGYSLLRVSQNHSYFTTLMDQMDKFGIPLEGLHPETGPGVYEAAIMYSDALEAADRAILFKSGVKEIAAQFGILASFMAKWNITLPGCSGHIHQSLWDARGNPVFFSSKHPHSMSPLFQHYVAGVIRCLPELLVLCAPTVNSYKRLVEGFWAPTRATWGVDNRTCALRVIPGSAASTRLEFRVPGADMNPYLAIAACLAAGLYGISLTLRCKAMGIEVKMGRDSRKICKKRPSGFATPTLLIACFLRHLWNILPRAVYGNGNSLSKW
jgi:glutamine synthetase